MEQRCRCSEQIRGHGQGRGKERVGLIDSAALTHKHDHVLNSQPVGSCSIAQEAQLSGMTQRDGMGGDGRETQEAGDICIGFVVELLSPIPLFATPWSVADQVPLSMGFPRQECQSGLLFPLPGDLPEPGIKSASPALAGRFFTTETPGKPGYKYTYS